VGMGTDFAATVGDGGKLAVLVQLSTRYTFHCCSVVIIGIHDTGLLSTSAVSQMQTTGPVFHIVVGDSDMLSRFTQVCHISRK